jgi:hypothetical protein
MYDPSQPHMQLIVAIIILLGILGHLIASHIFKLY